jgi:hypothetical protein
LITARSGEELSVTLEAVSREIGRADLKALGELLQGLGDFVESQGQGIDVFALQRRHEGLGQALVDFLGDAFLLPANDGELIQRRRFG